MANDPEEAVKNWQLESVKERQTAQERNIERLDIRLTEATKIQVTTVQLEERMRSITATIEDKLNAKSQRHDADIREVHLKYGPLADNYKWITRGIVGLVLAQLVALIFNLSGR